MPPARPKAAIIVSTYNWPAALELVLTSAFAQTEPEFELVVADDGSRPDTAAKVAAVLGPSRLRWCHVRQRDDGFRQARVRNLGVRHSRAPWLVFIDHDTPLHPEFVADHIRWGQRGTFLQGKRSFLPADYTERLLATGLTPGWWPKPWLRGLGNRKNTIRLPGLGRMLARPRRFQTAIRGCNLGVHREDFLAVDGFDELFDGAWGREDSDFCYRLFHRGRRCRNLWFVGLQAHLHHPQTKRQGRDRLDEELDKVRAERRTDAVRGYSKMDAEGEIVAASAGFGVE